MMLYGNVMPALPRRGSTLMLVLWVSGIATLIVLSLQVSAFRQASAGIDALGRVRARWAARAGVEECIAYLAWEVEHAADSDPVRLRHTLEEIADHEDLGGARYAIRHEEDGEIVKGPLDAHSRMNLNLMNEEQLMLLWGMEEDVARSILDWIDDDDEPREGGGTESSYYLQLEPSYEARNGPARTLSEIELVYEVDPLLLRGEDWNLNGVLDPNERDGDTSWPPDNGDGYLDNEWSGLITTVSSGNGFGPSGLPKLLMATATVQELQERMGVDAVQAQTLKNYASRGNNAIEGLITNPLSEVAESVNDDSLGEVDDLSEDQLRRALDEGITGGIQRNVPGKVNVNTASREVLELIPDVGPTLADQIVYYRQTSPRGFTNLLDMLEVGGMTPELLVEIAPYVDVRSNVYVITSKGWSQQGRNEVELVVTIDRSELPIRIVDYLER
jgi:type II secretory pathway component PulK